MTIHIHKTKRMSSRLESMLHEIKPIQETKWGDLTNKDKKTMVRNIRRINTLNRKINLIDTLNQV